MLSAGSNVILNRYRPDADILAEVRFREQKESAILSYIVDELLRHFGERSIFSIALVGGRGRGEKTLLAYPDGSIEVLSDYDVLVLVSKPTGDTRYMDLRRRLSRETGVDVEIGVWTCEQISRLPSSVFSYELNQHKILWGEEDLLKNCIPVTTAENIPLPEGSRLLFNRGSSLLLALISFLQAPAKVEARRELILGLVKMALALGEAYLIMQGGYHWSGQTRLGRIQSLAIPTDIKCWYKTAWGIKNGLYGVNLEGDVWDLCIEFLRACSSHHLSFECKRLNYQISSWEEYAWRELRPDLLKPWNYLKLARLNLDIFGGPRRTGHPPLWTYFIRLERRMRAILPLLLYSWNDLTKAERGLRITTRLLNIKPLFVNQANETLERGLVVASSKFGDIWRTFFA